MKKVFFFLFVAYFFNNNNIHGQEFEKIRLLDHDKWQTILNHRPTDGNKWQEFVLFARINSKNLILEEKTLSIVFNVIEVDGFKKVNNEKISHQLEILNSAFSGQLEYESDRDYSNQIVLDTKIKFCEGLPNDLKSRNYKTIKSPYSFNNISQISDSQNGILGANSEEYINIWITDLPDDMGGFSILGSSNNMKDGIYIDPDYFGKNVDSNFYQEGKTLVHLMGRYLGLEPLWSDMKCSDDGVEDTPIHNAPNYYCYPFSHLTFCSEHSEEMIGNFMDATPDECSFMFTKGQAARMHAMLSDRGFRKNLLNGITLCDEIPKNENTSIQILKKLSFSVIPNPANTILNIQMDNYDILEDVNIKIINIKGQELYSKLFTILNEGSTKAHIDISHLENGLYNIQISKGNENVVKPFIKL